MTDNKSKTVVEDDAKSEVQTESRLNRWKIFGIVIITAFATIIYVSNVLAVDKLLEELQSLKKQKELKVNINEVLKSKVNQLQSAERIIPLACDKLGMIKPVQAPEVLP
ncbi:MAG: septum formation initiator family protein [Bacteroidota bacterium]|jgi:cell division protein FtsB